MRTDWDDTTSTREIIREAIYTEDRREWLDPEDLEEIVTDVLDALGAMRRIRR